MYDSTNPGAIPTDAQVVAGYVDGRYAWSPSDWARFPGAVRIGIAVRASTNNGDVLDCEPGNATPAECPGWVKLRQAAGLAVPTIYMSLFLWPQVQDACRGLEVAWWVAQWTGQPHVIGGAAAVQYADSVTSGGDYDLSAVYDDTWHPSAPPPPPTPPPDPVEAAAMSFPNIGPNSPDHHDAMKVQGLLNAFGYRLVIDGLIGPASEGAIRSFQANHGLGVDGIAGPLTVSRLISA
jgi:hypothetical protein